MYTIKLLTKLDDLTHHYLSILAHQDNLEVLLFGIQNLSAKFGWRLVAEHDPVGRRINIYNSDILPTKHIYMSSDVLKYIEPVDVDGLSPMEIKEAADKGKFMLMSGHELWEYYGAISPNLPDSSQKFFNLLKFCGTKQRVLNINGAAKRCYIVKIKDMKSPIAPSVEEQLIKNGFGKNQLIMQILEEVK